MKVTEKTPDYSVPDYAKHSQAENVSVTFSQESAAHDWLRISKKYDSDEHPSKSHKHERWQNQDVHMPTENSYLDARLEGIEKSLDARMDAMQRLQERAEDRFEHASERHSAEIGLLSQKFDAKFEESRRHSTHVGIGVFAIVAIIATLSWYWISEQGSYARSYGETQVEIQQAADERAEFREAVKSIQATQQSILDKLPAEQTTSSP